MRFAERGMPVGTPVLPMGRAIHEFMEREYPEVAPRSPDEIREEMQLPAVARVLVLQKCREASQASERWLKTAMANPSDHNNSWLERVLCEERVWQYVLEQLG